MFLQENKLIGSTAAYFSQGLDGASLSESDDETMSNNKVDINGDLNAGQGNRGIEERLGDAGPESRPQSLSSITLAATPGIFTVNFQD